MQLLIAISLFLFSSIGLADDGLEGSGNFGTGSNGTSSYGFTLPDYTGKSNTAVLNAKRTEYVTTDGITLTPDQITLLNSQCSEGNIETIGVGNGVYKCPAVRSAVATDPYGQTLAAAGSCGTALKKAETQCKGTSISITNMVVGLASQLSAAKASGNTKAACTSAAKIQAVTGATNAVVATMCIRAINTCKAECTYQKDTAGVEACGRFEGHASAAVAQATQSAIDMVGSKACANMADEGCLGENAYKNTQCAQFCYKPENAGHAKCVNLAQQCVIPTFASQNPQICKNLGNNPVPTPGIAAGSPNLGDDAGDSAYDFEGATAEGRGASTNTPGGAGGGGLGSDGGSFAIGGDGGQGAVADPADKDILMGQGSGAAGGFFGGGGGGYAEGGRGGSGGSSDDKGIDLRAFLPGGKNDPSRNPASAGYGDPSITKANGLTNWQKVTRKMNEKRPELMP